ncbi:TPA: gallidermin family lantibiotic [Vibrio parahaemolyticus]|nr:gallidermin family lantibiotic [Vibrio parahaemolyticus]MBE4237412.1 gallidermin family protein [Vibrio parahaemolyticus]HCH0841971.1 gallidermin family lantibiotic [Vibrio parahaemolyticus]HCH6423670.1 gallidermin family lantibiotic [Vibrio parahaemolyticus]
MLDIGYPPTVSKTGSFNSHCCVLI